ncbi:alpha/beta hydrolase [Amycolatopsis suaedae]|uniref:alpha/beta hydrolase n=1 Tax=Amycolatopsis suaedae TaxID=2510978 RepID=UPI001F0FBEA5|nr:alpha/beta hydrolase [Amycolatopsis suaedae]
MITFVLVHGSGGNARTWSTLQQELALRGHRTLAIDLPGRGAGFTEAYYTQDLETFAAEPSPLAGTTLADLAEHVTGLIRRVREHGPVVLVGHSFGGLPVTAAATAAADLLDGLVYIAAQCPVDRAPGDYLALPEWSTSELLPATAPLLVADPARLGAVRVNWRGADAGQRAALRAAMCDELTDEQFLQVVNASQPDDYFWHTDPAWDVRASKEVFDRLPHTYVRLGADRSMPPAAQDRYIADADALSPANPFTVHTVDSSHGGFFRSPESVAEILDQFVSERMAYSLNSPQASNPSRR